MTTPTKNDSRAINTHTSSVNAKDKRSIRMTSSLVGRTRSPAMDELKYCYGRLGGGQGVFPAKIFFGFSAEPFPLVARQIVLRRTYEIERR
jgi:3-oxoacyl-(acyl-carrier-protein) synthase